MRLLELLALLRELPVGEILDLPDFGDREQCRAWLLAVCRAGKVLTAKTESAADDAVVDFLADAIGNPALFDAIHGWIISLLDGDDDKKTMVPPTLSMEADKAGIDPLTILAIVEAIAAIIKAIRDRRNK